MAKNIEIKSSLLNSKEFYYVKSSLLSVSAIDGKHKFRTDMIEYINDKSNSDNDQFFYDMIVYTRFLHPDDESTAYTTPDRLLYFNAPGGIGESLKKWDFIYDHECLHQLWETFKVGDKIKEEDGTYDHMLLNIASDCVINDYLIHTRHKEPADGIITAEYIKNIYGVDYNRNDDTQYSLYRKIEEVLKENPNLRKKMENDPLIDNSKKIKPKNVTKIPSPPQPPVPPPPSGPIPPDFIKGWTDAIKDVQDKKINPLTDTPNPTGSKDYINGYMSAFNSIKSGMERGIQISDKLKGQNQNQNELPQIPWDIDDKAKGDGDSDDKPDNDENGDSKKSQSDKADDSAKKAQDAAKKAQDAANDSKNSGDSDANEKQDAANRAKDAAKRAQDEAKKAKEAEANGDSESAKEHANKAKQAAKEAEQAAKEAGANSNKDANRQIGHSNNSYENTTPSQFAENSADSAEQAAKNAQEAADYAKQNGDANADKKQAAADKAKKEAEKAKEHAEKAKQAEADGDIETAQKESQAAANCAHNAYGYNAEAIKESEEELKKFKEDIEDLIEEYSNQLSGPLGEFIAKCKSSVKCERNGLAVQTESKGMSWISQLKSTIVGFIKGVVFKKKREIERTYKKMPRRQGIVNYGDPIKKGKRIKKNGLTINVAFYVDRSGSMDGDRLKNAFDASYALAESIKKIFKSEKLISEYVFKMFVFDDYIDEIPFGKRANSRGGTLPSHELMNYIIKNTNDFLINIIITDGEFETNESKMKNLINSLNGIIVFISCIPNYELDQISKKNDFKQKLKYIEVDSDFSLK